VSVIAVRDHRPLPVHDPVESARHPHLDALQLNMQIADEQKRWDDFLKTKRPECGALPRD